MLINNQYIVLEFIYKICTIYIKLMEILYSYLNQVYVYLIVNQEKIVYLNIRLQQLKMYN